MLFRYLLFILILSVVKSFSQKKPLDHSVYDSWQAIDETGISKNGELVFYVVSPQEGDNTLYLKSKNDELISSISRAKNPKLSFENGYLISLISPFFKDTRQAKIDKKKEDEMPKDSLAIYRISKNSEARFPNVKSYKLPKNKENYLVFLSEESPKEDSTKTDSLKKKIKNKLVVYNLEQGVDTSFTNVADYELDESGSFLAFTREPEKKDSLGVNAGVFKYNFLSRSLIQTSSGKGKFKSLTFDESGNKLAYLGDRSPEKSLLKDFKIYFHENMDTDSATILANSSIEGLPENWIISEFGQLQFSKSGNRLFFGTAPQPAVKDTNLVEFENAKVDIWHWQDDYLQPQQLQRLKKDQEKSYLSVLDFTSPTKILVLTNPELPDAKITEDLENEYILATTDVGRRIQKQWEADSFEDLYAVSSLTGKQTLVASNVRGSSYFSPDGNFIVWYNRENQNWYAYDIEKSETHHLNKNTKTSFADEDNDSPDSPDSYGISGWTADNKKIWIYDKYDIWSFSLDGTSSKKLSNGRKQKITFRYDDYKEKKNRNSPTIIDESKALILEAFNHKNKENGFYSLKINPEKNELKELVWAKNKYSKMKEAADSTAYILTKESYENTPNLYFTKDFNFLTQLSDVNLQQKDYNWGSAELVHWKTPSGKPAEGILYKPEDFDPNKTYPIIAYFYEKLSDKLYNYIAPSPTPSKLNISYFVSNGYVVFAPDIVYTIGYPGKSAEEYINSGMAMLKKNKWAGKLGIQGQSWGGYQVAHLITRTDMYDAAWTGAPVVNMTSAYGGIRWGTGLNRQFQYERTQSRIGATLWEKPELYIENSPLFHLQNVKTPVVIMHNDEDGAVPWYQGIEMFTALRRLEKPVWLLNYNGDDHNLVKRQNRKDIQRRQQQFFDYYLKGEPAPKWLEKGVPATSKGIDWGFDR